MTADFSHESIITNGRYRDLSLEGINPDVVKRLYRFMVRLRRFEQATIEEYHPADEMRCPVHFCVGQEAAPAALSALLGPDDYMFSHHRSHGYFLAKGAPVKDLLAELYGRATGANAGIAGSQDISVPSHNFYSGAILAGSVAIAVGTALACQLKGEPKIVVAGFGEGATDEGIFWESLNYAALRRLPLIFLCENNGYATYSHQLKRQPEDSISRRTAAFGVKSQTVFGNDVVALHSLVNEAMIHAREGRGPTFIEAYTYRWNGHVGPEDDDYLGYRPQAEIEFWQANCPIALLEESMLECGQLTSADKASMIDEIDTEIAEAFQYAKDSPFPVVKDWAKLNYSDKSPVADLLLSEIVTNDFDQNQPDAVPGPY